MKIRLQKVLSRAGVASRRRAEELMQAGRVRVNGEPVTELGVRVDPATDVIEVDGRRVRDVATVWIALHKPPGYVSTRSDPEGRPTIYDLLPHELRGLFYVGRLDRESEGLMLLTNEGDAAHRLLHPSFQVEREYEVTVRGEVSDADVHRLLEGIRLEDGVARAVRAERLDTTRSRTRLRLVLREGKKREIRRMLAALGAEVVRLVRQSYGPVRLGRLPAGKWRELTGEEVQRVRGHGGKG